MTNFTVTLADLRKAKACVNGYNRLVCAIRGGLYEERKTHIRFAHATPVSLLAILENNGLDDAIWALRCVKDADRDSRLFAVWCARQVEHLMTDPRSIQALDVAERFADGDATDKERDAARDAARAAAWAAAGAAARAAAEAAAWAAAGAAAEAAAWAAVWAAAWAAAGAAARAAAEAAAWAAQREMFVKMCKGEAPWQTAKPADKVTK